MADTEDKVERMKRMAEEVRRNKLKQAGISDEGGGSGDPPPPPPGDGAPPKSDEPEGFKTMSEEDIKKRQQQAAPPDPGGDGDDADMKVHLARMKKASRDREAGLKVEIEQLQGEVETLRQSLVDKDRKLSRYNISESEAYQQQFAQPVASQIEEARKLGAQSGLSPEQVDKIVLAAGTPTERQEILEGVTDESVRGGLQYIARRVSDIQKQEHDWVEEKTSDLDRFKAEELKRAREREAQEREKALDFFRGSLARSREIRPWRLFLSEIEGEDAHNKDVQVMLAEAKALVLDNDRAARAESALAMAALPRVYRALEDAYSRMAVLEEQVAAGDDSSINYRRRSPAPRKKGPETSPDDIKRAAISGALNRK